MSDIYYIVGIRSNCRHNLKLTTINKEFCGRLIRQSHGKLYFELNGSKALVIVPEEWISYCAPSKTLWKIRGQRAKCNPVDDVMDESIKVVTNKICQSESDHEWECTGISTAGTTYRCKKCYATKTYPYNFNSEISITI